MSGFISFSLRTREDTKLKVVRRVMVTSSDEVVMPEVSYMGHNGNERVDPDVSLHSVTIWISDLGQLLSPFWGLIFFICKIWGLYLMGHKIPSSSDIYSFM